MSEEDEGRFLRLLANLVATGGGHDLVGEYLKLQRAVTEYVHRVALYQQAFEVGATIASIDDIDRLRKSGPLPYEFKGDDWILDREPELMGQVTDYVRSVKAAAASTPDLIASTAASPSTPFDAVEGEVGDAVGVAHGLVEDWRMDKAT